MGKEDVKERIRRDAVYREREEKKTEHGRQQGGEVKRVSVGAVMRVAEWVIERD